MRASVGAGVDRICMRPLFDRMVRVSLIRNEPAVWLDLAWQCLGRAQSCRRGTQTGPSPVTVVTGLPAVSARFDGTAAAGTLAHQAEADVEAFSMSRVDDVRSPTAIQTSPCRPVWRGR